MADIIKGYKIKIPKVTGEIRINGVAVKKVAEVTAYRITNNLANCVTNNNATSVNSGSSYAATITMNSGYELMNISITMGGTNVTSSVYKYQNGNAVINIPNVTGDVVIVAQATAIIVEPAVMYTITRNLTNCTSSNATNSVNQGASYLATITPNSGYTLSSITVTMNGTDITDTAVNIKTDNTTTSGETLSTSGSVSGETLSISGSVSGETLSASGASSNATRYAVVNVSNVTGNIVISATAVEKANDGGEETPTVLSNMTYGKNVKLDTGVVRDDPACWATVDPVTVVVGQTYQISLDASWVWVLSYDESDNFVSQLVQGNENIPQVYTFTATTTKIRYGCYDPNKQLTYCNLTASGTEPIPTPTTYTVTRNLANCTSNNTANSVNQGASYSATVTPNSGYELLNVAITMGGANVTSSVYTYQNGNAVINIPSVTGDVVITIQATASSSGNPETPGGSGSDPVSGDVLSYMTYGKDINQSTAVIRDNPQCWATVEPVTIKNGTTYTISVDGTYLWVLAINDSGDPITPFLTTGTNSNPQSFTFTATTSKIKFGCYDPSHAVTSCTLTEGSSSEPTTTYTITKNLPNCTSSNAASSVNKNANYSTLISANNGYKIDSITVTMNGTDITSSVVTDE